MRAVRSLLVAILVASAAMVGYAFGAGAPDPQPAPGPTATAPPPRILGVSTDPAVPGGVDSSGRDGWTVGWHYQDRLLLGRLTVQATGPGGIVERSVAVRQPGPEGPP
jgi:hypothetical protein